MEIREVNEIVWLVRGFDGDEEVFIKRENALQEFTRRLAYNLLNRPEDWDSMELKVCERNYICVQGHCNNPVGDYRLEMLAIPLS